MRLEPSDLAAIADAVIDRLEQRDRDESRLGQTGRLGFTEEESARLLGLPKHVLRDARLRGEICAKRIGKRYVYSRATLLDLSGGNPK